ncbi:MAG: CinA family nicotinamide mononucleotide deamidase-related protein [Actinomycetota bacterium]|nr:CinA family nicotinamide mononucleotide deamidase-related protein [Actinomycetota bacterium]
MEERARAVVVVTGSELVRGGKGDANGPFLARELTRLGLEPSRLLVVGDDPDELSEALAEGLAADLCVVSGGLGPTHDDRTIELLASAAGRPLVVDAELEREIETFARGIAERLDRDYAEFAPGVRKQASLPEGGVSLGLAGTAPAVLLEHERGVAIALPGPPRELQRLWPAALETPAVRRLLARARDREHHVLRFFGASESAVSRAIAEAGGEADGLAVTVCAADLEVQVDLYAEPGRHAGAEALASALRARFPDELFAEDGRPVAAVVLDLCRSHGLSLATAESCTGGLVAARLTAIPGASDVFVGGLVAYANAVKETFGVADEVLARHGAVSAEAAEAMAVGVRRALDAGVAVAVTGVAGPGGGTPAKPVGLVFIAVSAGTEDRVERYHFFGDRADVRGRATATALHELRRLLAPSVTVAREASA